MTSNTSILYSLYSHFHVTLHWGESCKELGPRGYYRLMQHVAEYNHILRSHGIPEMRGRFLVHCQKSTHTEAKNAIATHIKGFSRTHADRHYILTVSDMSDPGRPVVFKSVLALNEDGEVTYGALQDEAHVVFLELPQEAHARVRAGIDRIMEAWAPLTSAMAGGERGVTTAIDYLRKPQTHDQECPELKFWAHWSEWEAGNLRKVTVQHGEVSLGYVLVFWGKTTGKRTGHATYTHINLPFAPTEPKDI